LVVEDDTATRAALVLLLQAEGCAADSVPDGRQALAYLSAHQPPRLILLDMMMPVMDGWTFLAERRKDQALAAVPVVIFTAASDVGRDYARGLGADAVLRKPADPEELMAVVARYC
jgi:CheY-like chemotaxis protein